VCTDFKILEVKVPIIFSGMQGFPLRRDGRYKTTNTKPSIPSNQKLNIVVKPNIAPWVL
jgi:hypothetical protein